MNEWKNMIQYVGVRFGPVPLFGVRIHKVPCLLQYAYELERVKISINP